VLRGGDGECRKNQGAKPRFAALTMATLASATTDTSPFVVAPLAVLA
jgi:hypothetical protein